MIPLYSSVSSLYHRLEIQEVDRRVALFKKGGGEPPKGRDGSVRDSKPETAAVDQRVTERDDTADGSWTRP